MGRSHAFLQLGVLLHSVSEQECRKLTGRSKDEAVLAAFQEAADRGIAQAHTVMGEVLDAAGKKKRAEAAYAKGAREGDADACFAMGVIREAAGKRQEAKDFYREAADAGHVVASFNLGNFLYDEGDTKTAETLLRYAASSGYTMAGYHLGILLATHRSAQHKEAEQLLHDAAKSGIVEAHAKLGWFYAKNDQLGPAEKHLRRAMQAGIAIAAYHLGLLLDRQERSREARDAFNEAYRLGYVENAHALVIVAREEELLLGYKASAYNGTPPSHSGPRPERRRWGSRRRN